MSIIFNQQLYTKTELANTSVWERVKYTYSCSGTVAFWNGYQADVVIVNCCSPWSTTLLTGLRGQGIVIRCDNQSSFCLMCC